MQHSPRTNKVNNIILASTSIYRKKLLEKLHLNFSTSNPNIDERQLANETVKDMVIRLSLQKAQKTSLTTTDKIIIASDQSACFNNIALGKPLNYKKAVEQLTLFSNQSVLFYTGLTVIDQTSGTVFQELDITKVNFRPLSQTDIHNYLTIEKPYQCAGSFKSEGLGISLFTSIESTDPNALIGLPLIKLVSIFKSINLQVPPFQ